MTNNNQGITRYYERQQQGQHGNNYYISPRDDCPLDVLNMDNRFVIVTFDKQDNYLVINGKRYYLNKYNAIRATDKIQQRVALVDIDELMKGKAYDYDPKFAHKYTAVFKSFDELRQLAIKQFQTNGCPYLKQKAIYHEDTKQCTYVYEYSFQIGHTQPA